MCILLQKYFCILASHMVTNFELRTLIILLNIDINIDIHLNINRFHVDCSMICDILYLSTISSSLMMYIFFDNGVICLQICSAITDFPSLCVEYSTVPLSCSYDFSDKSFVELTALVYPYLVSFTPKPPQYFLKCISN